MGWEFRKGKRYYYQKRRVNGRVVSTYVGAGQLADIAAELDALDRMRRQQDMLLDQAERATFAEHAQTPVELAALLAEARTAVHTALTEAGYHQHKRQWRKRRDKEKSVL